MTNVWLGHEGRLGLPAAMLRRQGWSEGTLLIAADAHPFGVLLVSRGQAEELIRRQLEGADPVGELLRERRAAAG